jgi:hypothetical protein
VYPQSWLKRHESEQYPSPRVATYDGLECLQMAGRAILATTQQQTVFGVRQKPSENNP